MAQSRRERLREATYEEIKRAAWQQMAEGGSAAISLRGIAAGMGITAPAIYRYYASREELITALIIDAYTGLGDAVIAAVEQVGETDFAGRFVAAGQAYRAWAKAHPADFGLIFGTPLAGYAAPGEKTVPLVWRIFEPFIMAFELAWRAGQLKLPEEYSGAPSFLHESLAEWLALGGHQGLEIPVFHYSLAKWGVMHGLVALELNGQFNPLPEQAIEELFNFEMRSVLSSLKLHHRDMEK